MANYGIPSSYMQGGRKRYEGAWRRGRRQGQGSEWYASGEQYSGASVMLQGTPMEHAAGCLALPLLDIEQPLPALHGMPSGKCWSRRFEMTTVCLILAA